MKLGRTVAELENSLSAAEYQHWLAMYALDPWGEQRDDMRMAKMVVAMLAPHTKDRIEPVDHMLFPDDAHHLPDDLDAQERALMLKLDRMG